MIDQENLFESHINDLHHRYPTVAKEVFEMSMYAFCLLQALIDSGLDFIFKGGTCMMLLLGEPKRISTDIDILVNPKTDLARCLERTKKKYPFVSVLDATKDQTGFIRHYSYPVPKIFGSRGLSIRLDILRENNHYAKIDAIPLKSPLLITSGVVQLIKVPSIECLLADKLTAFAPKTIGVNPEMTSSGMPLNNHLQVIKQFFDAGTLFDYSSDFESLRTTYASIATCESFYRGGVFSEKESLQDSFLAALSIATNGEYDPNTYSAVYRSGIASLNDHLFAGGFNTVKAKHYAANVMLLSAGLLRNQNIFLTTISNQKGFVSKPYNGIKAIKDKEDFNKAAYAIRLFDKNAR